MTSEPTDAEMSAALQDPDLHNALAQAVARTVATYSEAMAAQIKDSGFMPAVLVLPRPRSAIETYALALFRQDIEPLNIRLLLSEATDTASYDPRSA